MIKACARAKEARKEPGRRGEKLLKVKLSLTFAPPAASMSLSTMHDTSLTVMQDAMDHHVVKALQLFAAEGVNKSLEAIHEHPIAFAVGGAVAAIALTSVVIPSIGFTQSGIAASTSSPLYSVLKVNSCRC